MPKFYVFPKGYDPMVAGGPPSEWYLKKVDPAGWTPEETARHKAMEFKGEVFVGEKAPTGQWSQQVPDDFVPPEAPTYDESPVGISVWVDGEPSPIMGEYIGKIPDMTKQEIDLAAKVVAAVELSLKKANLLRNDVKIDVFT